MSIAVIGKGIIGMATALELCKIGRKVTLYSDETKIRISEEIPVSNVACALWQPYKLFKDLENQSDEVKNRVREISKTSLMVFHDFLKEYGKAKTGISIQQHYEYTEESIYKNGCLKEDFYYIDVLNEHWKALKQTNYFKDEEKLKEIVPVNLNSKEILPFDIKYIHGYKTYVIDTPVFMNFLEGILKDFDCTFISKRISKGAIKSLKEKVVFNCTGINGFKLSTLNKSVHSRKGTITPKKGVLMLYKLFGDKQFNKTIVVGELTILCRQENLTIGTGLIRNSSEELKRSLIDLTKLLINHKYLKDYGLKTFLNKNKIKIHQPNECLIGSRPYINDGLGYVVNKIELSTSDKNKIALYNNFGHGGSGVTLCFGSAKEAVAKYSNQNLLQLCNINKKCESIYLRKYNIELAHFDFKELRNLSNNEIKLLIKNEFELLKTFVSKRGIKRQEYSTLVLIDNKEKNEDKETYERFLKILQSFDIDFIALENQLFEYINQISPYFNSNIKKEFEQNRRNHAPLGCSQDIFIWYSIRFGLAQFEIDDNIIIPISKKAKSNPTSFYAPSIVTILPERLKKFESKADDYIKKTFGPEISSSVARLYHDMRKSIES